MKLINTTNNFFSKSSELRKQFFSQIDTSSLDAYEKSIEYYRNYFGKEVIGLFDDKLVDPNPRTRLISKTESLTSYEVVIDVFGESNDLFAYGILTVPNDIIKGSKDPW